MRLRTLLRNGANLSAFPTMTSTLLPLTAISFFASSLPPSSLKVEPGERIADIFEYGSKSATDFGGYLLTRASGVALLRNVVTNVTTAVKNRYSSLQTPEHSENQHGGK